jgi:uncharacterized delta-60 repeat protein
LKFSRSMTVTLTALVGMCIPLVCNAAAGSLDSVFGTSGTAFANLPASSSNYGRALAVQPDGKILVAGTCEQSQPGVGVWNACYFRYTALGELDTDFGNQGKAFFGIDSGNSEHVLAIATDKDGNVFGLETEGASVRAGACVRKLSSTGAMVSSFGTNGLACGAAWPALAAFDVPTSLVLEDSGFLYVGGGCNGADFPVRTNSDLCVARLAPSGEQDSTYGQNGIGTIARVNTHEVAAAIAFSTDGKLIAVGYCVDSKVQPTNGVMCGVRFDETGALDTSFGANGWFELSSTYGQSGANAVVVLPNGSFLVGGACVSGRTCVAKYNQQGFLASNFASNGVFESTQLDSMQASSATAFKVQSDDKILVALTCSAQQACVLRLEETGSIDTRFGMQGLATNGFSSTTIYQSRIGIQAQSNGDIVIGAGCARTRPPYSDVCVSRFKRGPYLAAYCTLNADANDTIAASSDAMLVTRYLLGFRGNALTNGAIGQNATRTADEIVTYLDSLKNDPLKKLDLDGDGESLALTDGLLMLRAMLGLSGDALTVGAMGQANATYPTLRTPQQILQWIETTHGVACLP